MASVVFDKRSGTRKIQFTAPDGKRKSIRLGKVNKREAHSFKLRVEALQKARITGYEWEPELATWVADRPDVMHARLEAVDLVPPRRTEGDTTLGELLDRFEAASNVKAATLAAYKQGINSLRSEFGNNKTLTSISHEDAAKWRKALGNSKRLAAATIAKRTHIAKAIFRRAVKWGLIPASPFEDLRAGSQVNRDNQRYIERDDIEAILRAAPDTEWRAIIALARFGGLRTPSETMLLRWTDISWERRRMLVRSPKTAGHGHAERIVPIGPRLYAVLLELFDAADDGAQYLIEKHRLKSANLRTQFSRIIRKAGLTVWPRLFHNLRASAECDWVEMAPAHTVAAWLGHSLTIAQKHYLQVRDAHFEAAIRDDVIEGRNGGAKSGALNGAKAVQSRAAANRNDSQESPELLSNYDVTRNSAKRCKDLQESLMGAVGFEPT